MKLCYVTDRKALAGDSEAQIRLLLERIDSAERAGVDFIQIREKDLSARQLLPLVHHAMRGRLSNCRVLLNDRLDVALIAGAYGVHLGEGSLRPSDARRMLEQTYVEGFLIGVSAHSVKAVKEAEAGGADYVIFGPVFATPSKLAYGPPQGLDRLEQACRAVSLPVIAIGGITTDNARDCILAGASGIAAIRLFQDAGDMQAVVSTLRTLG